MCDSLLVFRSDCVHTGRSRNCWWRLMTGVWGRRPQRDPEVEPLVEGSGAKPSPKAEHFFILTVNFCLQFCTRTFWICTVNAYSHCICVFSLFTALHGMQTLSYDEISVRLSVRLSVCLSVCQTRALWQNGKKDMFRFLYHTKEHLS